PTGALSAIWASGPQNVWIGGPEGPWRWDGQQWVRPSLPTSPGDRAVNAIWGCSANDVWAVGPVVTHWDGSDLKYVDMPRAGTFHAVWGSGCNDVWAGRRDDTIGSGSV